MAMDKDAVARFNSQRVTPRPHVFIPHERPRGTNDYGRCCVFSSDHAVHSTTPASNVVMFGGGRRPKR